MEQSSYKTNNPFSPWLTETDVQELAEVIHELMERSRYGAVVMVFVDGKLDTAKSTLAWSKKIRNGE